MSLALGGCGSSGGEDKAPADPASGSAISELRSSASRVTPDVSEAAPAAEAEQAFAFGFLQQLADDENITFSPHSLSAAFAMLTDAADGKTLTEIEQTLKFPRADEAFHRAQDALNLGLAARNRPAIDEPDEKVEAQTLSESNDVWIRDDARPQDSYLDTLARYYGAGVHEADFGKQPEAARLAINAKVSADTHELIPQLIPRGSIDDRTVLVLTNAMYFKAPWRTPFADAVPGDFHALDGSTKSASMMAQQAAFPYYEADGFVSVAVPYYGKDLELMLIVPDAGKYADVRGQLSSALLNAMAGTRTTELVALTLPKLDLQSTVMATPTLKALGMQTPFSSVDADFPKLKSPLFDRVYISDVLHQATVAIDEKGTEASAATAIVLSGVSSAPTEPPPQPKVVTVDRPFFFVIRDNPTGAVLFVGQVVAP